MVLVETITNPQARVVDVRKIAKRCRRRGRGSWSTTPLRPRLLYRPLLDGAWLTLHSVTKYIGGHNDLIGGAGRTQRLHGPDRALGVQKTAGSIMGPSRRSSPSEASAR